MNIPYVTKLYLLTIPVFFAMDLLWLGIVARDFYQKNLGYLFRPRVNWTAAFIFYFIFIAGILVFAVVPALERNSWARAVIFGGLFGFFSYATYDLTNLATVKDWPLKVAIVDMTWGVVLCSVVSFFSFHIGKWLS